MSSSPPGGANPPTNQPSIASIYARADARATAKGISHSLTLYTHTPRPPPLHIIIIGCGLGGLAASHTLAQSGHRITLVESAPAIGEIGAGIQVTPNVSRLLERWGLGERLREVAVKPEAIALRRWKDGELVGWTRWGEVMDVHFGAPYYHIHRADFHKLLFDLAEPHMTLKLNSTVVSINPSPDSSTTCSTTGATIKGPSVTLSNGEVIGCDLIVAADGVKSMVREVVLEAWEAEQAAAAGAKNGDSTATTKPGSTAQNDRWKAVPTGDAAYRAIVPTSKLLEDPDLKRFVEYSEMTGWMGPDRHIMAYCIRAKQEYNIVLIHPDDGSVESWTAEGSAEKMRKDFEGWEPRVRKLLSFVPSTLKWKLMDRQPLPTWVHPQGRVVLLGDACHPMLPYRAQGAAMAVEDAAVLGNLLSRLPHVPASNSDTTTTSTTTTTFSSAQLHHLLRTYESLRYPRTSRTQSESRLNQRTFHHPDGPNQLARDASMREGMAYERARWGMPPDSLMGSGEGKVGFGPGLPADKPLERGSESDSNSGSGNGSADGMMEGNANQWADQKKNQEQFLYDADAEVERWWKKGGEESLKALAPSPPTLNGTTSSSESAASGPALGFDAQQQSEASASVLTKRINARF